MALLLAALLLAGCGPQRTTPPGAGVPPLQTGFAGLSLEEHKILLKDGFFPGIVPVYGKFYLISSLFPPGDRVRQWVFTYNYQLQRLGWSKPLTRTPYITGEPDSDLLWYREHFYHAYSASSILEEGVPTWGNQLFLAKYDRDFRRLGLLQVIKDAQPEEETNDMFIEAAEGRLYLGTSVELGGHRRQGIRLRVFDLQLNLLKTLLLQVPGLSLHIGGHMMWRDGRFYLFTDANRRGLGPDRHLYAFEFDRDFKLLRYTQLTGGQYRMQKFPRGPVFHDGVWFIAYTERPTMGRGRIFPEDTGNIVIGVYDRNFHLLQRYPATRNKSFQEIGSHRASLAAVGDRLYLLYDTQYGPRLYGRRPAQVEAQCFKILKR